MNEDYYQALHDTLVERVEQSYHVDTTGYSTNDIVLMLINNQEDWNILGKTNLPWTEDNTTFEAVRLAVENIEPVYPKATFNSKRKLYPGYKIPKLKGPLVAKSPFDKENIKTDDKIIYKTEEPPTGPPVSNNMKYYKLPPAKSYSQPITTYLPNVPPIEKLEVDTEAIKRGATVGSKASLTRSPGTVSVTHDKIVQILSNVDTAKLQSVRSGRNNKSYTLDEIKQISRSVGITFKHANKSQLIDAILKLMKDFNIS